MAEIIGFQIPSTWFQSFNPLFIFLLAPLLDMFWIWQARKRTEPSSVAKMAIGCVILGLSFIVMVLVAGSWATARDPGFGRCSALACDRRGALSFADRAFAGDEGVSGSDRVADDGDVVPFELLRQYSVGLHRNALREEDLVEGRFFWLLTALGVATGLCDLGVLKTAEESHGAIQESAEPDHQTHQAIMLDDLPSTPDMQHRREDDNR